MPTVRHKRGTRSQIDAAATAGQLQSGEIYLITDENRLTVGTGASAHHATAKQSEIGGGGGGLTGTATLNLPNGAGVFEWEQVVIAVGVLPSNIPQVWLAATGDNDENDPTMIPLIGIGAVALTDEIGISMSFYELTSGPILLNWRI